MRISGPIVAGVLALLWLFSLVLPAVTPSADETTPGWLILMIGWLGIFVLQFGWFANPLFIAACVLIAIEAPVRWHGAVIGLGLLLLLANTLLWGEMYYDSGSRPIAAYHAGYYLWFVAIAGAAGWLLVSFFQRRSRERAASVR